MSDANSSKTSAIFDQTEWPDTFRISFLANRLVLPVYDRINREHGLTRGEYLLLFSLSHVRELTAQEVADLTGRPRNSISRAVHRMLKEGYLTRTPHPTDRRQAVLEITPQGVALHQEIAPLFKEVEARLMSALHTQEHKHLQTLLKKLVAAI